MCANRNYNDFVKEYNKYFILLKQKMHKWWFEPSIKSDKRANCIGSRLFKKVDSLWGVNVQEYWIRFDKY